MAKNCKSDMWYVNLRIFCIDGFTSFLKIVYSRVYMNCLFKGSHEKQVKDSRVIRVWFGLAWLLFFSRKSNNIAPLNIHFFIVY